MTRRASAVPALWAVLIGGCSAAVPQASQTTGGSTTGGEPSSCSIDGVGIAAGLSDPSSGCRVCNPSISVSAWTALPDQTACSDHGGTSCVGGDCLAPGTSCLIDGNPVQAGATNPVNGCQLCLPSMSASAWSASPDQTACGDGGACLAGQCVAGDAGTAPACSLDGGTVAVGTAAPGNGCQVCAPATSAIGFSAAPDRTPCNDDGGTFCLAGQCVAACLIDGGLLTAGAPLGVATCSTCQPAVSPSALSPVADGTACAYAGGTFCSAGACRAECRIDNHLLASGVDPVANGCSTCQPALSTSTLTDLEAGTVCAVDGGNVCSAGLCVAGCFIEGTVELAGALQPGNACQLCLPANPTAWSPQADATVCAAQGGNLCLGGSCVAGCNAGGTVVLAGAASPADACEFCNPAVGLQQGPFGTACAADAGDVCDQAGACVPGCAISGAIVAIGVGEPGNDCRVCYPRASVSAYSNVQDGTRCLKPGGVQQGTCSGGICG